MKNDFGGLLVTVGDVTYVPHQNWWSDTLSKQTHSCYLTDAYLLRLLLAENFDIKFFEFLPKMTGRGGGLGGISYFS